MENPVWSYIFNKSPAKEALSDVLTRVPIFDKLDRRDLRWIEQIIHVRHYNRNEIIFSNDEPGVGLYIVQKGLVRVLKKDAEGKDITLATLNEGHFFGEISLLDDYPRSATAIAVEPSILLGFFHPDLMQLVERKPAVGCKILLRLAQLLGERLRKTNELIHA